MCSRESFGSNQIKRGRSFYKCELTVPVLPNLLAKCDLAIIFILAKCELAIFLYFILAKCDLASWAIVGNNVFMLSKDQVIKVLYIKSYKYIGCVSIRKLPIKIVIYYSKMIIRDRVKFTQIAGENVYLPLLLRLANDVEENPGPTVYDVVDPSKTICADFSQDNGRLFRHNAAKQCVAMSLTAIVHSKVKNVNEWDSLFLNLILCCGNIYVRVKSNHDQPPRATPGHLI